jgi:hypothetical protein
MRQSQLCKESALFAAYLQFHRKPLPTSQPPASLPANPLRAWEALVHWCPLLAHSVRSISHLAAPSTVTRPSRNCLWDELNLAQVTAKSHITIVSLGRSPRRDNGDMVQFSPWFYLTITSPGLTMHSRHTLHLSQQHPRSRKLPLLVLFEQPLVTGQALSYGLFEDTELSQQP